jgi:tRNA nucleotidyltransferase (CCA-adding enzyme)
LPELSGLELPNRVLYDGADYESRLIALFYLNSEKPKEAFECAMKRLHTDSHIREVSASVIPLIEGCDTESDKGLTHILRKIGEEYARVLLGVRVLLGMSDADAPKRLAMLLTRGVAYKISDLSIDGKDLIALGAKGRQIGEILSRLLDEVIDGETENTKDALVSRAVSLL